MRGKIGVLMGGCSSEREISLKSGRAVFEGLKERGCDVVAMDIQTEKRDEVSRFIKASAIECAFLALHGHFGEDGQIQEILEDMDICYTGSGVLASKLAMDKVASRRIFEVYAIPVPSYRVVNQFAYGKNWKLHHTLSLPAVVKPSCHGSSIGLSIVERYEDLAIAMELAFQYDATVLIESFIRGRELTVGILQDNALPVIEILPKRQFFDYEAKYQAGMTEYRVPAVLDDETKKVVERTALAAHRLLGCRGCSRVDILLSQDRIPYVLEVNTIPGFTATSLLPKAARTVGIEFPSLCLKLIELAYEKTKITCLS
jgi:D-alanine-D-alanine ligase